jgi:flagellar protein FliO/FliZ
MLDFINQSGPVKFFVAFAIVLALIGLTAWLVRRFSANRLGGSTRGRQPRLAVIDAATVDGRRRLVLIRRDNVEHLMMIGGPNDLVVEPNIVRATATRDSGRDGYRPAPQESRSEARSTPVMETNGGSWPLQPTVEPPAQVQPQPRAVRDYRAPVTDEPWVAPEPPAREPAPRARPQSNVADNSISSMASEFNARLNPDFEIPPPPLRQANPPVPVPMPAREPAAVVPPPPPAATPPLPAQTDRNLAEMAQRLEAALRRPNGKDDIHPPVTDPLAAPNKPATERAEPKLDFAPEVKAEPKFESKFENKPEPKVDAKPDAKAKNPFDSLEEEMASLLGRQPGKT